MNGIKDEEFSLIHRIYLKMMALGGKAGCHQRPERSFFIHGYQFPVCARCTGVIIGYLITIPIIAKLDVNLFQCIFFASIMLADWLLQYLDILVSTNIRRVISGIFGGFGVFAGEILLVEYLIKIWIAP